MKTRINKFQRQINEIKNHQFRGWDFSYLSYSERMKEFPLSWNYYNEVLSYYEGAESLLDMGTGGGEFLSKLPNLPKYTCATEGYEPNIDIAQNRLKSLGIKVYPLKEDSRLPFEDSEFDIIINRHESFSPKEVKRILKNKGYFITQQVGGLNDYEINFLLGAERPEFCQWNLNKACNELLDYDFKIIKQREGITKSRFYDIGALIYYLKAIPWQIPDFSIDKYYDRLLYIHDFMEEQGFLDVTCHRFFIVAKKLV